jgi:hypothetical protein
MHRKLTCPVCRTYDFKIQNIELIEMPSNQEALVYNYKCTNCGEISGMLCYEAKRIEEFKEELLHIRTRYLKVKSALVDEAAAYQVMLDQIEEFRTHNKNEPKLTFLFDGQTVEEKERAKMFEQTLNMDGFNTHSTLTWNHDLPSVKIEVELKKEGV